MSLKDKISTDYENALKLKAKIDQMTHPKGYKEMLKKYADRMKKPSKRTASSIAAASSSNSMAPTPSNRSISRYPFHRTQTPLRMNGDLTCT